MVIGLAILFGLVSFLLQVLPRTGAGQATSKPFAIAFGLGWLATAIYARLFFTRRAYWAFAPAPLVLWVPLAFGILLAACKVTYCDL
jgi:hypothetical protein